MDEKKLWADLYEVAEKLKRIQIWNAMDPEAPVLIRLDKAEVSVLCSVMGSSGICPGISVYQDGEGIASFSRLIHMPLYAAPMRWDITCLTLYWGDRLDVPKEQKAMIKDLGLKFRGNGNWPFVVSCKRRYAPASPSKEDLAVLVEALQNLYMVAVAFATERMKPEWNGSNALYRYYDKEKDSWSMFWTAWSFPKPEYPQLTITDELFLSRINRRRRNQNLVLADLIDLNASVPDDTGKLAAVLAFVMLDADHDMILRCDVIPPETQEAEAVIQSFVTYLQEYGRMRRVKVRNPYVYGALKDICEKCKIPLVQTALPEMDAIAEDMSEFMFGR